MGPERMMSEKKPEPSNSEAIFAEAEEAYKIWEREAYEANEGRSVFKKVFLIGRKTAMSLAYNEALEEDKYRKRRDIYAGEMANFLRDQMILAFREIFSNQDGPAIVESINNHSFSHIFSEDDSGRLVSEVILNAINQIYSKNSQEAATLIPVPVARAESKGKDSFDSENFEKVLNEYLDQMVDKGEIRGGILHITEHVKTGESSNRIKKSIVRMSERMRESGLQPPENYAFITVSGGRNWAVPEVIKKEPLGGAGLRQRFVTTGGQKDAGEWKLFTDVKKIISEGVKPMYEDKPLSATVKKLKERIVKEASEEFVTLYDAGLAEFAQNAKKKE